MLYGRLVRRERRDGDLREGRIPDVGGMVLLGESPFTVASGRVSFWGKAEDVFDEWDTATGLCARVGRRDEGREGEMMFRWLLKPGSEREGSKLSTWIQGYQSV